MPFNPSDKPNSHYWLRFSYLNAKTNRKQFDRVKEKLNQSLSNSSVKPHQATTIKEILRREFHTWHRDDIMLYKHEWPTFSLALREFDQDLRPPEYQIAIRAHNRWNTHELRRAWIDDNMPEPDDQSDEAQAMRKLISRRRWRD